MNRFSRHPPARRSPWLAGVLPEGGSAKAGHSSLLLWWSHRCQNVRLIAKIFRSHLLDSIERHCVHVVVESLVIVETESVEFVQRAMITKSVVALIRDLLLTNQFLFRSRQFFRSQTIIG